MRTGSVTERIATTKRIPAAHFMEASEGDHDEVGQVLINSFRTLDRERFYNSLLDPDYKPEHRLLARISGRLASHVLMARRSIRIDQLELPISGLVWLGTVPEFRGRGLAEQLIKQAVKRSDAAKIGLLGLTTRTPDNYEKIGWVKVGLSRPLAVSSRNLPTEDIMQQEASRGGWTVRPWRQVELSDLMRIYDRQLADTHIASVVRSESYWRWIVGMRMAHVIWVACRGDQVKGYAFVKDHHVLEIAADLDCPEAFKMLLGRIRAESLERAYPEILLDVPSDHPVVNHLSDWPGAGRSMTSSSSTLPPNCLMMKVANISLLLNQLAPELDRRARAAGMNSGELGLSVGSNRWTLRWDAENPLSVESGRSGRKSITVTERGLVLLVMGQESIETLVLSGFAHFQHSSAAAACELLFPRRSLWRSVLDRFSY